MKNSPRQKSIGAQMAIALQLMKRGNHNILQKNGYKITIEQIAILEMLHFYGDMNMSELSKATWKQNANITRIVDRLEKQKLLVRKLIKEDRRAFLLSITDLGIKTFNETIPLILNNYKKSVNGISKDDQEITLKTLKKIIDNLS